MHLLALWNGKGLTFPVDDRFIVTLLAFILFIIIDNYVYNNIHQVLLCLPCVAGNLVKKVMVIILGILVVMEAVIVNRREVAPIIIGSN